MSLRERLEAALGPAYRLHDELGGGGMSHVFAAEEVALGRRVVVKVLPPEMAATVNAERFQREIRTVAGLQHPHIVPLIAAGGAGDLLWFTMPLVEGEELRAKLTREGRLPEAEAVRLWSDVLDALAHAHAKGVVHRDIKPENVLVSGRHALVADFGVSKAVSTAAGERPATATGLSIGTPAYMAPEQGMGESGVDHRADLYAAGLVMYEMLTGQGPFPGRTPVQLLVAHATEPVPPVEELRPDVRPELSALVMQCLAKEPKDRPVSADAVLAALGGTGGERSGEVTAPTGSRPPDATVVPTVVRPRAASGVDGTGALRRRRRMIVGGVVAVAVAGGAAGVLWPRFAARGPAGALPDTNRVTVLMMPPVSEPPDSLVARTALEALSSALRSPRVLPVSARSEVIDFAPVMGRDPATVTRDTILRWLPDLGYQSHLTLTLARSGDGFLVHAVARAAAGDSVLVDEQGAVDGVQGLPGAIGEIAEAAQRALARGVGRLPMPEPTGEMLGVNRSAMAALEEARVLGVAGEPLQSLERMREAARLDSTNAMVWMLLHNQLSSLGVGRDERLRAIARAREFAPLASFRVAGPVIAAQYHSELEDHAAAVAVLERLIRESSPQMAQGFSGRLGGLYIELRRHEDARRVLARQRDTTYRVPTGVNTTYIAVLLDLGREAEAREELRRLAEGAGPEHPITQFARYQLFVYGRQSDSILAETSRIAAAARTTQQRNALDVRRFLALQQRGQLREARRLRTERAERMAPTVSPAVRLTNALALADWLVRATGDTTEAARMVDDAFRQVPFERLPPMDRPYSMAIQTLSHLGRVADARRISEAADRDIPAEFKPAFAADLAATRLELALAEGDAARAYDLNKLADVGACAECRYPDNARIWDALGNADSARTWYERYLEAKSSRLAAMDAGQLALSYRRAGELHEQAGDLRKALQRYRQFVELWKDADAELQPQVEEVRQRIVRLAARIG